VKGKLALRLLKITTVSTLKNINAALFQEIELEISLLGNDLSRFDHERQLLNGGCKGTAE
jgi:hypothetical protein